VQRRAKTITNHYHHHIFCTLTIVHFNSKAICRSRVRLYFEVNSVLRCLGSVIMWNILSKRCDPKRDTQYSLFLPLRQKLPRDAIGKVNVFCCVVEQQHHPFVWGKSGQSLGHVSILILTLVGYGRLHCQEYQRRKQWLRERERNNEFSIESSERKG